MNSNYVLFHPSISYCFKLKYFEFPAGKMIFNKETKKVTADKRQGKIIVYHVIYEISYVIWKGYWGWKTF